MKKCPLCGGDIQNAAIKCKHCKRWLNEKTQPAQQLQMPTIPIEKPSAIRKCLSQSAYYLSLAISLGIAKVTGKLLGTSTFAMQLVAGGSVGAVCGLLPYFIAKKKNNKLKNISLWSCILSGVILGLFLAVPVAIIFSIIIALQDSSA